MLQQLKAVYNPRPEWSEAVQRNLTVQVNMWLVSQIIEYMEKEPDRQNAAYLAGFAASGEGYNGEYPFRDMTIDPR